MRDGDAVTTRPAGDCIYLRSGVVQTGSKCAAAETIATAGERMIVQLDGPLTKERAVMLEAAGVRLGQYLPTNAYLVEHPEGVDPGAVDRLDFVRWHGAYQNGWKMVAAPEARGFATDERKFIASRGECVLVLSLFESANPGKTVQAIEAIPGMIIRDTTMLGGNQTITVVAPIGQEQLLIGLDDVLTVEEAPEATPRMATSTWIVQSNVADYTPLHDNGLTGAGQIVSVIDLPVDDDNCVFRDETAPSGMQFDKWVAILDNSSPNSHGTAVCSMIAGDGGVAGSEIGDLRGIAYDARLVFNRIPAFDGGGADQ